MELKDLIKNLLWVAVLFGIGYYVLNHTTWLGHSAGKKNQKVHYITPR